MPKKPKAAPAPAPTKGIIKSEEVDITTLKTYYKNPRVGNVNLIAESLKESGQYRTIVVNVGTHTGRPNEILAGNHTYLGMRKIGMQKAHVSFVDVDEAGAAKIVAVDNKAADDGTYDDEALAEVLKLAGDLTGTGFTDEEAEALFSQFEDMESDVPDFGDMDDDSFSDPTEEKKKPRFQDVPLGDEDDEADPEYVSPREKMKAKEEGRDITKASDELVGAFQLSDDMFFKKGAKTHYEIPALREDMLVQAEDLPDNLTSWAGSATKGQQAEDPTLWFLYNWGIDSTSGMDNTKQCIISFFAYDEYFENWWHQPSKYVAKALNSKIEMICTPDFSDEPNHGFSFNLWQTFRNRWVGRFCQEAGLKVIPNICWPDGNMEFLQDVVLDSLPEKVPVAIMQLQTLNKDEVTGGIEHLAKQVQAVIDRLDADVFILYSGKPGKEFFDTHIDMKDTELRWLLNRQAKLAEAAKGRERKKGI